MYRRSVVTSGTVQRAEKELKLQKQNDKPVCLYYCDVLATASGSLKVQQGLSFVWELGG
jgi:hypothetical protein